MGVIDLCMDLINLCIFYVLLWEYGCIFWFVFLGGEVGGVFKLIDGGDSWMKFINGLFEFIGKVGIDVFVSNLKWFYVIVEVMLGEGGFYCSDDVGESWQFKNESWILWMCFWYYMYIVVDFVDDDVVYVFNVFFMKLVDGGFMFEKKSMLYSDYYDYWINLNDNQNMINVNDGGVMIIFDGGRFWLSLMNQLMVQFYCVNIDNEFLYWIYGGQQDNLMVVILSEIYDGGIGNDDFFLVGGGESVYIVFDFDDLRLIYVMMINGILIEYNRDNQCVCQIKLYFEFVFGMELCDLCYCINWNVFVIVLLYDFNVIYYGIEKVL